ncbi:MAG: hypothetical protein NTW86_11260 [Candidatus Sumerlaeota bacterium]|nr:hypothetical protein [Candidatus Sumerlaeota bacterium]
MIKRFHLFAMPLLFVGVACSAPAQPCKDLDGKDVFTKGLPTFFVFREDMVKPIHASYKTWEQSLLPAHGVIKKYVSDELPGLHPEIAQWANRFAESHPSVLMLLHLNGEARQTHDYADAHQRYFPGHWVYQPGALLAADVKETDTVLHVEDAAPFKVNGYRIRKETGELGDFFPQDLCIVWLNAQGERLWYESEYARLTAVDAKAKTVAVERGQYCSKPMRFQKGAAYVAPLAAGVWGGKPMWFYNMSSLAPKDKNGRGAADVFAAEIAEWFRPTGPLKDLNGIAFDVHYWSVRFPGWDTDNDGQADDGIVGGVNVWREGEWHFDTTLRQALGDGLLLTADGHGELNQRAVGVFDGIESEGLIGHNDAFRAFSSAINVHTYWREYGGRAHDFRYVVLKLMNADDRKQESKMKRLAVGTACCLEASVTSPYIGDSYRMPEIGKGVENQLDWLGRPSAPLLRLAAKTPDLLNGAGAPMRADFVRRFRTENCAPTVNEAGEMFVAGASSNKREPMRLTLDALTPPPGDLTMRFEAQAVDPLIGFDKADRVPRQVRVHAEGLPPYEKNKRFNDMYTDLFGYAGTQGYCPLSFFFRKAGEGGKPVSLTIEIEEQGAFKIRNFAVHSGTDALAREFDHGVVLVNPSLDPYVFHLKEIFPQLAGLRRIQAQPNTPGAGGNRPGFGPGKPDEDTQRSIAEAMACNNGAPAGDAVAVPALDALFLIRPSSQ